MANKYGGTTMWKFQDMFRLTFLSRKVVGKTHLGVLRKNKLESAMDFMQCDSASSLIHLCFWKNNLHDDEFSE